MNVVVFRMVDKGSSNPLKIGSIFAEYALANVLGAIFVARGGPVEIERADPCIGCSIGKSQQGSAAADPDVIIKEI
jgi:hypothetical protein